MVNFEEVIHDIEGLPSDWHGSGPLSVEVLKKIGKYCAEIGSIEHSVETGTGKSTLLFSQISQLHVVFAIDVGNSLTRVRESPLLCKNHVQIIEGPTQSTLPEYEFKKKIQVALIDGPHGYPFPDLEYYYIYQHLDVGAIFIIDDINIPTIKKMTEILKKDKMFDCLEVVGKTAFFKRTDALLFDPLADGWWDQGYNQPYLKRTNRLRYIKEKMPKFMFNLIPGSLKLFVQRYM